MHGLPTRHVNAMSTMRQAMVMAPMLCINSLCTINSGAWARYHLSSDDARPLCGPSGALGCHKPNGRTHGL